MRSIKMDTDTKAKSLKVWAFSAWLIPFFAILSPILYACAYGIMRGRLAYAPAGMLFGSIFLLNLIQFLFCRIMVDAEGVIIHTASIQGNIYHSWDELDKVKWAWNGRAVSFGMRSPAIHAEIYWIVPFSYRELAEAIRQKTPLETAGTSAEVPKRIDYAILLVPIFAWALLATVLRWYGFHLNLFIDAVIGGATGFFSASCFAYRSWHRFRVGNLDRWGSALVSGLMMRAVLFLFALIGLLGTSSF